MHLTVSLSLTQHWPKGFLWQFHHDRSQEPHFDTFLFLDTLSSVSKEDKCYSAGVITLP